MRCPKCHYLSFEPEPRCKNCGYDLDLPEADLELRPASAPEGPMADLTLREIEEPATSASVPPPSPSLGSMRRDRDREREKAPAAARVAARSTSSMSAVAEPPPARQPRKVAHPSPALRTFEPRRTSEPVAPITAPALAEPFLKAEPVVDVEPVVEAPSVIRVEPAAKVEVEPEEFVVGPVDAPAIPPPAPVVAAPIAAPKVTAQAPVTTELPLFVKGWTSAPIEIDHARAARDAEPIDFGAQRIAIEDETPLVTLPAEPRVPLAVRRPTPEVITPKPRAAANGAAR